MDSELDSGLDLGFVNFRKHPSDNRYTVFRFKEKKMADYFRTELEKQNIWFEEGSDTLKNNKEVVMFGVHNSDFNKVQKINYQTSALHREKFISNKPLRLFLMAFFIFFIAFAIYGVIKVNFL